MTKPFELAKAALFLVVSITVLGLCLALLAGWRPGEPKVYYVIFHGNVSGLAQNGPVTYRGLKVGSVQSLEVIPEPPYPVRVTIAVDENLELPYGVKAIKQLESFAGNYSILLYPPDHSSRALQPRETITGDLGPIDAIQQLASPESIERFKILVSDLNDTINDSQRLIRGNQQTVAEAIRELTDALREIRDLIHSVGRILPSPDPRRERSFMDRQHE